MAAAAAELYELKAAVAVAVAAGLDISLTQDPATAVAGSQVEAVAAARLPAHPAAAAVLPAPSVAVAVLPTHPTQSVAAAGSTTAAAAGIDRLPLAVGTPDVQEPAPPKQLSNQPAQEPAQVVPQAAHRGRDLPLSDYSLDFLRPLSGAGGVQLDTVLLESLTHFRMDDKLRSSRLGIPGLSDLYRVIIGLHDDLKAIMADPDEQGDTLRKAFSRYYFTFMGLRECSPETGAAIGMLYASQASQGFNLRVSQALKAGIGLKPDQMQAQATYTARTEHLPDRMASVGQLDQITNGDRMGLLGLTVELLCYNENKPRIFENKRQELLFANLQLFGRCSEALAHILQLYQAATTAYGSEFMTKYDLLKLVVSKLKSEVQFEIADMLAADKTLDLINMSWRKLQD